MSTAPFDPDEIMRKVREAGLSSSAKTANPLKSASGSSDFSRLATLAAPPFPPASLTIDAPPAASRRALVMTCACCTVRKGDGSAPPGIILPRRGPRRRPATERDTPEASATDRLDPFEVTMLRGAALALRRRADRQSKIDEAGTMRGDRGVLIRTGEAVLAGRLSSVLGALAADFEREIL